MSELINKKLKIYYLYIIGIIASIFWIYNIKFVMKKMKQTPTYDSNAV